MIIVTQHCSYRVSPAGDHFEVVKVEGSDEDSLFEWSAGTPYTAQEINIEVGKRAFFDGWATAVVKEVSEGRP